MLGAGGIEQLRGSWVGRSVGADERIAINRLVDRNAQAGKRKQYTAHFLVNGRRYLEIGIRRIFAQHISGQLFIAIGNGRMAPAAVVGTVAAGTGFNAPERSGVAIQIEAGNGRYPEGVVLLVGAPV